jgi:hypothetical protein
MGMESPLLPGCGMPPRCLISGVPAFCACNVAVNASILRSSSATLLSAFFWRFRVGGVVMQGRPALAHRLHDTSGRSWSQRTFSPRHESHALGRLRSTGDLADPGVPWALVISISVRPVDNGLLLLPRTSGCTRVSFRIDRLRDPEGIQLRLARVIPVAATDSCSLRLATCALDVATTVNTLI